MARMKYIIFEELLVDGLLCHDVPLVFPPNLNHADVARAMGNGWRPKIHSAGECSLAEIKLNPRQREVTTREMETDQRLGVRWMCYGKSTSLDKESDSDFDELILDSRYR